MSLTFGSIRVIGTCQRSSKMDEHEHMDEHLPTFLFQDKHTAKSCCKDDAREAGCRLSVKIQYEEMIRMPGKQGRFADLGTFR